MNRAERLPKRPTGELAIRDALKSRHLRHHSRSKDVLIIDELGLAHAKGRVDVAVFNGHLHGYEIKSMSDTLERLPRQIELYSGSLQKLTLVAATKHFKSASSMAPEWCGMIEVVNGPKGGLQFVPHRRATLNPDIDPFMLAHLLWRPEAQELLLSLGASNKEVNAPRSQLYRSIAAELPVQQIAAAIKRAMASRKTWRDHQLPLSYGG